MQKKLTPHCRQCPSEADSFATCGLLTIPIFWDAVKKNCNNSLTERLEKTVVDYRLEIGFDESKILVDSIKPRSSTIMRMNGKVSEEVDKFKYLGSTKPRMVENR